jgi:NAD(P)H-dependent FMN reductase
MKKILAFAGSNSSTSINHSFVEHVASGIEGNQVEVIRLTDFPLPLFSVDLEKDQGYPEQLGQLLAKIKAANGLIISVNEHNGTVSAFFKNVLDWLSRLEYKFLQNKQVLLLSASPGRRGGLSANEYTTKVLPRFNGEVVASFTFPSFDENFSLESNSIINEELSAQLHTVVKTFLNAL